MATVMSAWWVQHGYGIPDVCSRHGRPEIRRGRMVIESKPPGWTYATIPAGLLIFAVLRAVLRKAIVTPAWPFCERCGRRRTIAIAIASTIVAAGVATMVAGFQSSDEDVVAVYFGAGLVIALTGYVGFHWATPAAIAGVRLTGDGQHVTLKRASAAFEARLIPVPPASPQWMPPGRIPVR
jgi:hypothetical protein